MTDYISYFNGEWAPLSRFRIVPGYCGFTIGDVVFDVERAIDGNITAGASNNVFIITAGVIRTPGDGTIF